MPPAREATAASDRRYSAPRIRQTAASDRAFARRRPVTAATVPGISSSSFLVSCVSHPPPHDENTHCFPPRGCQIVSVIAQAEIRRLPLPEKLALLEAVWTELASDPAAVEVPQWHKDILDERQQLLEHGSSQVLDWELAKEQMNRMAR